MTAHKVLTRREPAYPFKACWVCSCGHRFSSRVMGSRLYQEFAQHQKQAS